MTKHFKKFGSENDLYWNTLSVDPPNTNVKNWLLLSEYLGILDHVLFLENNFPNPSTH